MKDKKVTYRTWTGQKAALTRAVRSGDRAKVKAECERVVRHDWTEDSPHSPYWPDDWRRWLRALIMASADTVGDRRAAMRAGWRVFRTRGADMPLRSGEIICPASAEGGKRTTCAECHLCDGRKPGDKRPTIAIIAHGATASRWESAVSV